jgi:hypothetical protein
MRFVARLLGDIYPTCYDDCPKLALEAVFGLKWPLDK